ncbi:hypothetical protein C8Q79DRAFT_699771 [Trametes meyenii]|nr:hypothetical protein C8Q79DRAFT_699771 [Trametes meyenii]
MGTPHTPAQDAECLRTHQLLSSLARTCVASLWPESATECDAGPVGTDGAPCAAQPAVLPSTHGKYSYIVYETRSGAQRGAGERSAIFTLHSACALAPSILLRHLWHAVRVTLSRLNSLPYSDRHDELPPRPEPGTSLSPSPRPSVPQALSKPHTGPRLFLDASASRPPLATQIRRIFCIRQSSPMPHECSKYAITAVVRAL